MIEPEAAVTHVRVAPVGRAQNEHAAGLESDLRALEQRDGVVAPQVFDDMTQMHAVESGRHRCERRMIAKHGLVAAPRRRIDHGRVEVDAERLYAAIAQQVEKVARTAADVGNAAVRERIGIGCVPALELRFVFIVKKRKPLRIGAGRGSTGLLWSGQANSYSFSGPGRLLIVAELLRNPWESTSRVHCERAINRRNRARDRDPRGTEFRM